MTAELPGEENREAIVKVRRMFSKALVMMRMTPVDGPTEEEQRGAWDS